MKRSVMWTLAMLCAVAQGAETPSFRQLTVDTATVGMLRAFNGSTGAPAAEFAGPMGPKGDASDGYKKARIDLIRTHDAFGPSDFDARFGTDLPLPIKIPAERNALNLFPDMKADPDKESSYNFAPTDRLLASIQSVGAQTIFRIGRSIGADPTPPDADLYARIARHVVQHYNQGWARGFHYGIKYWEVWNEPDFKVFWTGTPQQYYALYAKVARAVKQADPSAQVGGSTISLPLDATPYRDGFLEYVRAEHLPLDFFSWHFYTMDSNDPATLPMIGREMRALLDKHGLKDTKNVVDEWNADLFDRELSPAARAAFAASAIIYMVDSPIDLQVYYRGDPAFRADDGKPDPVGQALIDFGAMKDTPVLLKTRGGDDAGYAVLAGRSPDGRTLQVMISNFQIAPKFLGARPGGDVLHIPNIMDITLPPRRALSYHDNASYDLTINLAAGDYEVARMRTGDDGNLRVERSRASGPVLHLTAPLPAPGVEFIKILREP